ncbi:MAG TPA: TonB family protein [Terriglobales bacterium]|nr:TonB family protein [Terriglobales bacterium]
MPEAWKQWEGQVVNEEFPLLRHLGGSEHSAVFLTKRADRDQQEVAIKLILANAENPELQLSWWELAAKLSHPHLLRLFQWGHCQIDGTELLYAVAEYAEESLAQILPYRPLTPEEARDLLRSVLDALAYVHAKGFVHGHIKPANIMAVGDQIKLSSDGLYGSGETSQIIASPSIYAAPEITNGGGVSPASDVWSLGMTLVEALTQHPPDWEGTERAEVVLPETLPTPFSEIASHSVHRDPQRRWTVAEISTRLRQPSPVLVGKQVVPLKGGITKWGYLFLAIAAGLLLAILGPKLFHRHPAAEPGTAVESSASQPAPQQGTGPGQAAPIGRGKNQASGRSHAASHSGATKNGGGNNNSGARAQGTVVQQILPDVSRNALRTVQGKVKVRVKVTVDSSGNVTAARFDSQGPSRYFAERSLRAARQWTFKPPQVDGQGVPSEWILGFEFQRAGASVHPSQTFP